MILYIGNNIKSKTNNVTTLQLLTKLLKQENYDVHVKSSKSNQIFRLFDMLFSVLKYRKKIDYILIDTYSTRNFYYAFFTSQLARVLNIKYIPILHGGNLPTRLVNSARMSQSIFENSYKNVAPSNYLKEEFLKHGYNVDYIPNVLEMMSYKYNQRIHIQPKLLYVRALQQLYNPQMAIYVLAALKKEFPSAELCFVGPDKDGSLQECKNLTKRLGVECEVTYKGLLPKKQWHELSEKYDVFINTTTIDNTPISVMEAMALGLPVVSTNVGGMPYLITDHETGFLVNSNAVDEMVFVITKLISNDVLAKRISESARSQVEQFDWEIVKTSWKALLK